jgi:hypothetical protein
VFSPHLSQQWSLSEDDGSAQDCYEDDGYSLWPGTFLSGPRSRVARLAYGPRPVPCPHGHVHLLDAFLGAWGGLGVLAQRDGVPCFIEDVVVLSRERRPATSTFRRTRLVGTGRLGEVKQWAAVDQVTQAADAAVKAPTPFEGACLGAPQGDGAQPLFAFDSEPPCGGIAERPSRVVILGRIVAWSQASCSGRRLPVPADRVQEEAGLATARRLISSGTVWRDMHIHVVFPLCLRLHAACRGERFAEVCPIEKWIPGCRRRRGNEKR